MTFHAGTLTEIAEGLNQDNIRDFGSGKNLPLAFFITDQKAIARPEGVVAVLPSGCAVILRDYDHQNRKELGEILSVACRKRQKLLLVAGDEGLAITLRADGIHLPERQMAQAVKIRATHPKWLITTSCHCLDSVRRAADLPINAAMISPVFLTLSHPDMEAKACLGLTGVAGMVKQTTLPLYALGGIGPQNIHQLVGSGVAGIAAIRGFKTMENGPKLIFDQHGYPRN